MSCPLALQAGEEECVRPLQSSALQRFERTEEFTLVGPAPPPPPLCASFLVWIRLLLSSLPSVFHVPLDSVSLLPGHTHAYTL